jgi:hypothetical protein
VPSATYPNGVTTTVALGGATVISGDASLRSGDFFVAAVDGWYVSGMTNTGNTNTGPDWCVLVTVHTTAGGSHIRQYRNYGYGYAGAGLQGWSNQPIYMAAGEKLLFTLYYSRGDSVVFTSGPMTASFLLIEQKAPYIIANKGALVSSSAAGKITIEGDGSMSVNPSGATRLTTTNFFTPNTGITNNYSEINARGGVATGLFRIQLTQDFPYTTGNYSMEIGQLASAAMAFKPLYDAKHFWEQLRAAASVQCYFYCSTSGQLRMWRNIAYLTGYELAANFTWLY